MDGGFWIFTYVPKMVLCCAEDLEVLIARRGTHILVRRKAQEDRI